MIYHPFLIKDSIPEEEDIVWEMRRLRLNRSGGLSGMRTEHLRQCLHKAMWDDAPGATNWQRVVAIVQVAFRDRTLAKESTWQGLILIPKGGSG